MNATLEQRISAACAAVTAVLCGLFLTGFVATLFDPARSALSVVECVFFLGLVIALLWGNFLYQFARLGYFRRKAAHSPTSRQELERCYNDASPASITVLIPSYKEELHVLKQTILSAALLDYPRRRIAVLVDNPPNVRGSDLRELMAARAMIEDLNETFSKLARPFERECELFLLRKDNADIRLEGQRLARLYEEAADRIKLWAEDYGAANVAAFAHHDRFFVEKVLNALAEEHRSRAQSLASTPAGLDAIAREYNRLAALFRCEIKSFERKRYVNLSHEPNKAMNLNSYIGLMGRSFREERRGGDVWLVACAETESGLTIPESDYVLTLDADSILLPDYALRLAHMMDADPAIAVAQTPYSAFPGAPGTLERIAGATTDLQYIVHQGFTSWGATYWVGANALLRLEALRDIEQQVPERGHFVPMFIQDRTVIEDTESTVDLISRGWTLINYPERLAYSATPPDFGSLVIQRRRWADGGLIILPKLLRYLAGQSRSNLIQSKQHVGQDLPRGALAWAGEALMRTHYLCSPAAGSFGLLVILAYPFDDSLTSIWLIATAVPYYFLYGRDLHQSGYRFSDLPRVYALILLLLSVNISGVARSLGQILTGRKSSFARTPKIEGRTASSLSHIVFQWAVMAYLAFLSIKALLVGRYGHAAFALVNLAAFLYAVTYFVGWRNVWTDATAALSVRRRSAEPAAKVASLELIKPLPAEDRFEDALAVSGQKSG